MWGVYVCDFTAFCAHAVMVCGVEVELVGSADVGLYFGFWAEPFCYFCLVCPFLPEGLGGGGEGSFEFEFIQGFHFLFVSWFLLDIFNWFLT